MFYFILIEKDLLDLSISIYIYFIISLYSINQRESTSEINCPSRDYISFPVKVMTLLRMTHHWLDKAVV